MKMDFNVVKDLCERKTITYIQLGCTIGIIPTTMLIWNKKNDCKPATADQIFKICRYFHIDVNNFDPYDDEKYLDPEQFMERLTTVCGQKDTTPRKLLVSIGMDALFINVWEKYVPAMKDIIRISKELDCDLNYLLTGSRREREILIKDEKGNITFRQYF